MSEVTAVNPLSDTRVNTQTGVVEEVCSTRSPSLSKNLSPFLSSIPPFLPPFPPPLYSFLLIPANLAPPLRPPGKNRPAKRQGGAQIGR